MEEKFVNDVEMCEWTDIGESFWHLEIIFTAWPVPEYSHQTKTMIMP
jgi:hypothetical protein